MSIKYKKIIEMTFNGNRFKDHSVDIPFLAELIAYQNIVKHLSKIVWRTMKPIQKKIPNGFEKLVTLRFSKILPNCVTIPLKASGTELFPVIFNALEKSVLLINDTIISVNENKALPAQIPKQIIPELARWGSNLTHDDQIILKTDNRSIAYYTYSEREKMKKFIEGKYKDSIDITGEVMEVNLKAKNFHIYPDDGSRIKVKFNPKQEKTVIKALDEHESLMLRVKGTAIFKGTLHILEQITDVTDLEIIAIDEYMWNPIAKPFWKEILELSASIPEEELDKLPKDLAQNIDHYVYGSPSK